MNVLAYNHNALDSLNIPLDTAVGSAGEIKNLLMNNDSFRLGAKRTTGDSEFPLEDHHR